jgi:hypothetical protein
LNEDYFFNDDDDIDMLKGNINDASHSTFSNSNVQQGSHINDISIMLELQKGYQEMIKKRDEQIDRLIGIIEQSNKN